MQLGVCLYYRSYTYFDLFLQLTRLSSQVLKQHVDVAASSLGLEFAVALLPTPTVNVPSRLILVLPPTINELVNESTRFQSLVLISARVDHCNIRPRRSFV